MSFVATPLSTAHERSCHEIEQNKWTLSPSLLLASECVTRGKTVAMHLLSWALGLAEACQQRLHGKTVGINDFCMEGAGSNATQGTQTVAGL